MKETRICKECGREFIATNGMQQFCNNIHYRTCVICGAQFEVKREYLGSKDARTTCTRKCASILRKQTNVEKYGGVAPSCSADVQNKIKATNIERYGVAAPMQSDIFKKKSKQTCLERYGVEHHTQSEEGRRALSERWNDSEYAERVTQAIAQGTLANHGVTCIFESDKLRERWMEDYYNKTGYHHPSQNPEVQERGRKTLREHYGVDVPLQSNEIKQRMIDTNITRYGAKSSMQNESVREKSAQTCLKRYGTRNYLQSEEGKQRVAAVMLERYGVRYYSQSLSFTEHLMKDPSRIEYFKKFDENPQAFILSEFDHTPSLQELAEYVGTGTEAVSTRLDKHNCRELVKYVFSYMEDDVYQVLKDISPDVEIIRNTKKVITPYEIDIYLPEFNLGIECNPTSTHNSSVNTWSHELLPLPRKYHQDKTNMCDKQNIQLFHIFGYEWITRRDIIISMLRNLLKRNLRTIYARNTVVKEVSGQISAEFLDNNHRQGNTFSNIRLGLYTKDTDELVSLMTFGKMRSTIGTSSEDLTDCYELVRFCSIRDTSVIGGASKLFSYFCKYYSPKQIRSFSDRAHTSGKLYEQLGFNEVRRSDPGYVWVNLYNDKAYHRVNAQKHNLKKFLNDDSIDLSQTESQIMVAHNFVQVFDSGTITWEWKLADR